MREYPRFLFSDPKNTKSKGPFVVHCLEPRIIMKVQIEGNKFSCVPMDTITDPQIAKMIVGEAERWLYHQIATGEITL